MKTGSLLIRNGRILDPANQRDAELDLRIREGKIVELGHHLEPGDEPILDASGKIVTPGFVDMHVHLREPGREDKETIATGTRAAAAGGFTTVCPMPNTSPVCDSAQGLQFLASRSREKAVVHVVPVAAVTQGQKGEAITEFGDLVYYGAKAFSDDGHPIMNAEIMRRALEYTAMFDVPVLDHCEDLNLSEGGLVRSGSLAFKLGLKGIPAAANSCQVARDIDLARHTGGRVHICHISVRASVEYIATAKARGVNVTCEVTPHHLALNDTALADFDPNFKMSPPLGTEDDRQALVEGLRSGVIDCIATDHAPHTVVEKDCVFSEAPFGVIGLETAFPVVYTRLVREGGLPLSDLIEKMTCAPAQILRLEKGTLSVGADADVTLLDLETPFQVEPETFYSRARNCPFAGMALYGKPWATVVMGRVIFQEGKMVE